ncbi:MAG: GerMN domain-containing protein, partial [bacterium]|nr:GerMN domain-containing protein [bacterium]
MLNKNQLNPLLNFIILCLFGLVSFIYAEPNSVPLVFYQQGVPIVVARDKVAVFGEKAAIADQLPIAEKAKDIVAALVAGPTPDEQKQGFTSAIPANTKLLNVEVVESRINITLSKEFFDSEEPFDSVYEYVNDQFIKTFTEEPELREFYIYIEDKDGTIRLGDDYTIPGKERLQKLQSGALEFGTAQPPGPVESVGQIVQPRPPNNRPTGALSGKRIGINAGHGWWYSPGYWALQRGNIMQYIEDIGNWERCLMQIARYLWNAGAEVYPSREWDSNTTEVIANNDSGAPTYTETGAWTTSGTNGYNTSYRWVATNTSSTTATATWQTTIPRAEYYAVYQYHRPGTNRVADAQYIINHSGGQTLAYVNQKTKTTSDSRWVYIGTFYFNAGAVTVTLTNYSKDTSGSVVIADAIRFGGGIASTAYAIKTTSSAMNRPWWQGAASYYTKYIGAPSSVYNYGSAENSCDWYSRPGHAVWENCDGYLMVHTNAFNGNAHGTVS